MQFSVYNKHVQLASAFISGISLGYLICLHRRKCNLINSKYIDDSQAMSKCNGNVCPIDMNAVFKQAYEQPLQQPDQPLN